MPRLFAAGFISLALLTASDSGAAPAPEPTLPGPIVALSIEANSAAGPWTIRVTNNDVVPIRIRADARLLKLKVRPRTSSKYTECSLPGVMKGGADPRELVLQQGESWKEQFDPRLFCFGKTIDELVEGTSVTAWWGFAPDPHAQRLHRPQKAPFVVEPAVAPATFAAVKQLVSSTIWLPAPAAKPAESSQSKPSDSAQPKPAADKPSSKAPPPLPPGTPINTTRLELNTPRFVDASTLRDARMSATVENRGDKAATVHMRADRLEFVITTPNGSTVQCGGGKSRRAAVRDFFHSIGPKRKETLTEILGEACSRSAFRSPGVYSIRTTLHADEDGSRFGLHAETGDLSSDQPTLVRLQQAPVGYYTEPPTAQPAPKP